MANKENKEDRSAFQPSIFEANPEKERKIFEFRPGTAIWLSWSNVVYAREAFIAEKLPDQKWAGYSAYKILKSTPVYRQRGWDPKSYFSLETDARVGIAVSLIGYRPKKLR